MPDDSRTLLLVGGGGSLGPALARRFRAEGMAVAVTARNCDPLSSLAKEVGARSYRSDASRHDSVRQLFETFHQDFGSDPDVVIYNAHRLVMGSILELDPAIVASALEVNALGAFLVGQEAAKRMAARGTGTMIFTGATASLRGSPAFSAFSMGKAAARMLSQSLARELGPKGVHVAHVIVDGGIEGAPHVRPTDKPDSVISPDAIADAFVHLVNQPRNCWTQEIDLRPWSERF